MYLCLIYMKTLYFHPNLIIASSQNASILSIAGGSFARILAITRLFFPSHFHRERGDPCGVYLSAMPTYLPMYVFRAVHAQERAKVRKQILTTRLYFYSDYNHRLIIN
jgi:hypothetical protein